MDQTHNRKDVKWVTLDSADGEHSIKQHAFVSKERKYPYTLEPYPGNTSLCNQIRASDPNTGDTDSSWKDLENEFIKESCCKNCLKVYNKYD